MMLTKIFLILVYNNVYNIPRGNFFMKIEDILGGQEFYSVWK